MKKRLLALLLCLVMVIGLVPTAFAGSEEPSEPVDELNLVFIPDNGGRNQTFWRLAENFHFKQGAVSNSADAVQASDMIAPEGKHFVGWSKTQGVKTDIFEFGTDKYPNQVTLKLYGIWEENTPAEPEYYTIRLKANDGTINSTDIDIPVKVGESTTLPTQPFKRSGYTLVGWSSSSNATSSSTDFKRDGATVSYATAQKDDVITLYAVWEEKSEPQGPYSVTYHETENPRSTTKTYTNSDSTYTLKDYEELWTLPEGKTFKHWVDSFDNVYTKGTTLKLNNHGLELYPVFEDAPATKYTVTFYCWYHQKENDKQPFARDTRIIIDPNGGTYAGSTTKTEITVTSNVTVKDASRYGYSFDGWYVTKDNAGVYTFTAVWDNNYYYNTYSIYYYDYDDCKSEYANFPYGTSIVIDPNGGTAKLSGTSFSTKQYFNIYRDYTLTDASRSGYTFYGWDLTKSGSTYYFTAMWSRYKSDVPYMLNGTDHYAYIKGYPNGSFKPTDTITRAEAATIFYRLLTDSTRKAYATSYNTFKDVPATAWYNTAVSTMAKLGIVNGGADGYFRPNDPITRAEIAAMIARCDGAYYTGTSTVFSDTYGHWAAGYIDRAYELGWINGYGTTYAPDRYISRAETVAVLNRVLNRAPQYTSDLTRNYTTFSDVATSAWYYLDVEEAANSHTYTRKSNADYETWTKLIADPSWF